MTQKPSRSTFNHVSQPPTAPTDMAANSAAMMTAATSIQKLVRRVRRSGKLHKTSAASAVCSRLPGQSATTRTESWVEIGRFDPRRPGARAFGEQP
jgi:hypothetical protein